MMRVSHAEGLQMSRNLFVSYRFRDAERGSWVEAFLRAQGSECEGRAVFWDTDPTQGAESAIRHEVNRVVNEVEAVLVVLGGGDDDGGSWLDREVQLARKLGVAVAAVRLPGVTDGIPDWIRGGDQIPIVDWGTRTLCEALSQARRIH
jgi:hypothetical protein